MTKPKEKWEERLEDVFEDLIKDIPFEYQPPFMPMLLAIRKERTQLLKEIKKMRLKWAKNEIKEYQKFIRLITK
jgi:hypothetical protein